MPSLNPSIPESLSQPDAGVSALAASAGTAEAVTRGYTVAAVTMAVVMLGALGVAFRPVIIRSFAGNAAKQAAVAIDVRAARSAAARATPAVQAKLARLAELERLHRARHPLLFALALGGAEAEAALVKAAAEEVSGSEENVKVTAAKAAEDFIMMTNGSAATLMTNGSAATPDEAKTETNAALR